MTFSIYKASEDQLIRACIRKDRKAQKLLYESYAPRMYTICCRYLKNESEAEDVLVISFMKIFEKISQYRFDGSFEGWMKRIVVNEALGLIRSKRQMLIVAESEMINTVKESLIMPDRLEEEDLLQMISKLPEGYRSVFNMFVLDGFSHKEIGEVLGISENTSKSQLNRARHYLQKMISRSDPHPKSISR